MRLAIIVTEFPKVTETFILRDLVSFNRQGHDIRIYHLTRFRKKEVLHDFALPTLAWVRYMPYFFGFATLSALLKNVLTSPVALLKIAFDIICSYRKEPTWLIKSILLLPKCLAISADIQRWRAQHVHAQFATHPATAAWINHRLTKIPYSVSCHAHDIFLTQSLLNKKLGEASFVRTVSQFNKNFLQNRIAGLQNKDIEVIHVSMDMENIKPFAKTKGDEFKILYIGSLENRKGINFLIEALAKFKHCSKNWSCQLIGMGPERKKLEELVVLHGLQEKVVFKGARQFEEIITQLHLAHVVVVPSIVEKCGRTEGLPTVIIESFAYQRPVIASRVTGIPELVIDGETGLLVEPGNSNDIYHALVYMYENPDKAYCMAKKGHKRIVEEFDLNENVSRQLLLFKKFAAVP